ncbi:MAG: prolipoprotein diacylglyceryl transferase [Elusimicrobia bacterium]|nr:prolipoprotein diacylglyceryl transferase [Elusimicrobiota bacterium]
MHPVLLKIGSLEIPSYGVLVAGAFLAAAIYLQSQRRRAGLSEEQIQQVLLWALLSGILGAKIFYVALSWDYFAAKPWRVLTEFSYGFVFYGGFAGAVLGAWLFAERGGFSFLRLADLGAPATALAHAIGRLGCLAAGCCYGRPTGFFWGVRFSHPQSLVDPRWADIPLHPTQLYESVFNFGLFLFLHFYGLRSKRSREEWEQERYGRTFVCYVILYALGRAAVEFFRGDDRGGFWLGLSPAQWMSAAAILAGIGFLLGRARTFRSSAGPLDT